MRKSSAEMESGMIYTQLEQIGRYVGISAELDEAIAYIQSKKWQTVKLGRNEIAGDKIFLNRFNYQTMDEQQCSFEAHIDYIDIHMLQSGHEKIGVSDVSRLLETERMEEKDYIGYQGKIESRCSMDPDKILIVFPEDAHMVKIREKVEETVEKIVIKVKCSKVK